MSMVIGIKTRCQQPPICRRHSARNSSYCSKISAYNSSSNNGKVCKGCSSTSAAKAGIVKNISITKDIAFRNYFPNKSLWLLVLAKVRTNTSSSMR